MERLAPALGCRPADLLPGTESYEEGVEVALAIDSTMGGMLAPLSAPYQLPRHPRWNKVKEGVTVLVMEGEGHAKFGDGTELVFRGLASGEKLASGQMVLVEEKDASGARQRYIGTLEQSAWNVHVTFRGSRPSFHRDTAYTSLRTTSDGLSEHSESKASGIPVVSGNRKIVGVLLQSITSE